jgi:SAM-dependent methyltransferase
VALEETHAVTAVRKRARITSVSSNPEWQRRRAGYLAAAELLPPGAVLDLGCGAERHFELLAPRESVGLDRDRDALRGQPRATVVADIRELPFPDATFASVLAANSIDRWADPRRVLEEAARVLEPGGTLVIVTPNRNTAARADGTLQALCTRSFAEVAIYGLFASERYLALAEAEPPAFLRLLPRIWPRARGRFGDPPEAAEIDLADFALERGPLEGALDLVAVCRGPNAAGE